MDKKLSIEQYSELEELIVLARYSCCYGTNDEFIRTYNKLYRKVKEYLGLIISSNFTNYCYKGKHTRVTVKDFIEECCDEDF